jgi:hypothetical protein
MPNPLLADSYIMGASHCGAALAALTLLLIFACGVACGVWPTTAADYYQHRVSDPASNPASNPASDSASDPVSDKRMYVGIHAPAQGFAQAPPDMRWWRWPGYAAPLELSLPLYNFQEYIYGYPPVSRLPYNA